MARDASTQTHWSWLEDSRRLGSAVKGSEVDDDAAGIGQPQDGGGVAELLLPPLNQPHSGAGGGIAETREGVKTEGEALRLPKIVDQLQAVDFGSYSSSEGEEEDDGAQPPYPDTHASTLLSPAILHYLRESQSLANKFFALGYDWPDTAASHDEGGGRRTCDFCEQEFPQPSLPFDGDEREVTSRWKHRLVLFSIMPCFPYRISFCAAKTIVNSAC